jgi:hypothetical protein
MNEVLSLEVSELEAGIVESTILETSTKFQMTTTKLDFKRIT